MAKNETRRRALADAGLSVLAREGSRGLTHRAIDIEAHVPAGTTSNYFRTKELLIAGLVERIGERLAPTDSEISARAGVTPSKELFADYVRDIVHRLTVNRDVTIALYELRLESTRRPEIAALMSAWQRAGFDADVAFNTDAGLPGGRQEIALFHYAIEGLVFDRLTNSIDSETTTDDVVTDLVDRLLR